MAQESLVVLVYLVVYQGLLLNQFATNGTLKALYNLFEDRLVEHQLFAIHHGRYIATCEQLACLQDDTIGTSIEHINPQLLVQYLTSKNQHLYIGMYLLGVAADFYTYGSRTTQTQIEQHQVGLLLLDEAPVGLLVLGCSNHFGLGNITLHDAKGALKLQGHIFYYYYFEVFHTLGNVIIIFVVLSCIVA